MICRALLNRILTLAGLAAVSLSGVSAQDKAVFTETFESGKLDPAVWDQRVAGTATLAVEEVEGARGKYALHVHYPEMAARSYAFAVASHLPESVRTHFFGRVYMKIAPALGMNHNPLIFAGEPGWPLSKFEEIGTYKGTWQPSYQENKSPAGQGRGETTFHAESGPPAGKWFLLEWEFNDDPASITYWLDGEQVMTLVGGQKSDAVKFVWPKGSTTASGLVGGFQELGLGARVWGAPAQGFDIYYDDLAIGKTRLGPAK
ncbi:MAG: hypothetical protein ABUS51_08800 [Acidobacteriota bacterium]